MNDGNVYAIVLAAGLSRRFGGTKQLAEWRGEPLVARAVRLAEAAVGSRFVLVTGHDRRAVTAACRPLAGFIAVNDDYAAGIGTSIAAGIRSLPQTAGAVLILLADQPLVTGAHLESLIDAWRASPQSIVASAYAGTVGTPAVLPRRDFDALAALSGDAGAKRLIAAAPDRTVTIEFEPAAVDVDRPEDLQSTD